MTKARWMRVAGATVLVAATFVACGDDDPATATTSGTSSKSSSGQGGAGGSGIPEMCTKYGGMTGVASVVRDHVLPAVAADCRINAFFATLTPNEMTHLTDCLVIQMQEVFGCAGVMYAGSMDSLGVTCRDMATAHAGLAINQGDYDAFLDDVVQGLAAANVDASDIGALADVLLGFDSSIIEDVDTPDPSQSMCMGTGGAGGSGGGAGGN